MTQSLSSCVIKLHQEHHALEDYQGGVPRWCNGCGDNAILAAMQRLCVDENLAPENTVFVTYCAGPHCNGAVRGALRLAELGRPVKIMAGGITGWIDEGFSLTTGSAA